MQSQPHRYPQRQQLLIAMLVACGAAIIGGSVGLLVGRQADIIFDVDAGIVGMIAGAVLGSLLPLSPALNPGLRVIPAGLGVLLPALVVIGSARVAPEVLWGMTAVAMLCSGLLSVIIHLARRASR